MGAHGREASANPAHRPAKTGVWNTTTAELARQDACNEVIAAAGVQVQLVSDIATFRANFPIL